jgi:ribonuclease J
MASGGPILTVHRSTHSIGGNCIELTCDGHRLLIDAGEPLDTDDSVAPERAIPATLDTAGDVDALVISHPHQDHYGLLTQLPQRWPVWCGKAAGILMDMTARVRGQRISGPLHEFRSGELFTVGPFSITPYLTDHSAFDAYMLLVECAGRRILYSGDFRRAGRKAVLVERMMAAPPKGVDVLLLEGTTLGREGAFPTESELENAFLALFRRTTGRVFVSWSGQNIDRTVTIYRACKRSQRTLVLDVYTLDVLERLSELGYRLPRLGIPRVRPVITSGMIRLYGDPTRMDHPAFVEKCATAKGAIGAASLESRPRSVVMLRPSLARDFHGKGVKFNRNDAWVFSMWKGYLDRPDNQEVRRLFEAAGASIYDKEYHTSGHASGPDLEEFARRVAPRHLVPVHGDAWDQHLGRFANVRRLPDGEPFEIA